MAYYPASDIIGEGTLDTYKVYINGHELKQPIKASIGQYADYIDNVWNLTTGKKVDWALSPTSLENGHTEGCSRCYKPYVDLFTENIGEDFCKCMLGN